MSGKTSTKTAANSDWFPDHRSDVWRCTRCYLVYSFAKDKAPCPRCGNPEFGLVRKYDKTVPAAQLEMF